MFRDLFGTLLAALALLMICTGCSGTKALARTAPATINTIDSSGGLLKKIAVFGSDQASENRALNTRYMQSLLDTLRDEDDSLVLITPEDAAFPRFLLDMAGGATVVGNALELAEDSRMAGFHGVLLTSIRDIRVNTKRTGILWFRRPRHFLSLSITLDLYDPYTAAKLVGAVEEVTLKIDDVAYDAYVNDADADIEDLNETVEEIAEDLGERVADTLDDFPWQISVVDIRANRLILPAGRNAGLREGQRLFVFEGRRVLAGANGERFIVPGPLVAEFRLTTVMDEMAEASGDSARSVQVGDIAVPVR